jgi:tetratricopeptide (TPR) repeat protein
MISYALTQTTAWWYYIANWWVPSGLIADHASYPVYGHIFEPRVGLALLGWVMVGMALWRTYGRRPAYLILALTALALISPTSSFLPLAEMVNEHRPYLALGCLSLLWLVPLLGTLIRFAQGSARVRYVGVALSLITVSGCMATTYERNAVFATWASYWEDVVEKAPSWRAHLNLGWYHLREMNYERAEIQLNAARTFAPHNVFIWTNLAILYEATKRHERVQDAYGRAVAADPYNSIALEMRGRYYLRAKAYDLARQDFKAAGAKTMAPFELSRDLGVAEAGRGDISAAIAALFRCRALDARRVLNTDTVRRMVAPFWDSPKAHLLGIGYFKQLDKQWPNQAWLHGNLSVLYQALGRQELSTQHGLRQAELEAQ